MKANETKSDEEVDRQCPSVEDRLRRARYRITLALAAAFTERGHMTSLAEDHLDDAVGEALEEAIEELHWVAKLPGAVLNVPAPCVEMSVDEADAPAGGRGR